MIRPYKVTDFDAIKEMHSRSGLPASCMPQPTNPNFIVRLVAENGSGISHFGGVKLTGEAFVLVDHEQGTEQQRWETLSELIAHGLHGAAKYGLDDVSAWLPKEIEKSFGPRLQSIGWLKSPWQSYSALLR